MRAPLRAPAQPPESPWKESPSGESRASRQNALRFLSGSARKALLSCAANKNPSCVLRGPALGIQTPEGDRLWLRTGNGALWAYPAPGEPPLFWQEGRWWQAGDGAWFWLKGGRALGREAFASLSIPQGTAAIPPIFYSRDSKRAAASLRGGGMIVFDPRTGAILALAPSQDMHPRRL